MPGLAQYLDDRSIPEPNSGCWLWLKSVIKRGYAQLKWQGVNQYAHRLSWLAHRGPIPDGLQVLHKCDVPSCINPAHLFLGTHQDNMDDKVAKGRQAKGSLIRPRKLNADQVRAIRIDPRSQTKIAKAYGISQSNVSDIKLLKIWQDVR